MDAIILVGGQGTRLRPLTFHRHKSLVPVANRPAISYLFDWLRQHGVERAVLALGRHNEDLADAYPPGSAGGLEIIPVFEQVRLESGGAIRHAVAEAGIDDRFLVLNGDVYVEFDLAAALGAHESTQANLTLALAQVDDPSPYGVAVTDASGMVTGFVEKPPRSTAPSRWVNAGVWIFEREIVEQIPEGAVRVEETLFPSLVAREKRLLGYPIGGTWADLGTANRYLELNVELARRRPGGDARLSASFAGPGTTIGDGAHIEGSVLWEDVEVGSNVRIVGSILADGVSIGEGAMVTGLVAGKGASVPAGALVESATVLQPGERYDPGP